MYLFVNTGKNHLYQCCLTFLTQQVGHVGQHRPIYHWIARTYISFLRHKIPSLFTL